MLISSAGRAGHGVPVERVIDLVEDLRRIGTVVRLQQGPQPFLAEEDVRGSMASVSPSV